MPEKQEQRDDTSSVVCPGCEKVVSEQVARQNGGFCAGCRTLSERQLKGRSNGLYLLAMGLFISPFTYLLVSNAVNPTQLITAIVDEMMRPLSGWFPAAVVGLFKFVLVVPTGLIVSLCYLAAVAAIPAIFVGIWMLVLNWPGLPVADVANGPSQ